MARFTIHGGAITTSVRPITIVLRLHSFAIVVDNLLSGHAVKPYPVVYRRQISQHTSTLFVRRVGWTSVRSFPANEMVTMIDVRPYLREK